jgi:hypothetical protein
MPSEEISCCSGKDKKTELHKKGKAIPVTGREGP